MKNYTIFKIDPLNTFKCHSDTPMIIYHNTFRKLLVKDLFDCNIKPSYLSQELSIISGAPKIETDFEDNEIYIYIIDNDIPMYENVYFSENYFTDFVRMREPVYATMVTFKEREKTIKQAVMSIIKQVTHMYIYLNDYSSKDIPLWMISKNITIYRSPIGDTKSNGKFYALKDIPIGVLVLPIDDDIIYPYDYVFRLKQFVNDNLIVSAMGKIIVEDKVKTYHFSDLIIENKYIDIVATSTMMFYNDGKFDISIIQEYGKCDIFFSLYCRENNKNILLINHPPNWLISNSVKQKSNIHGKYSDDQMKYIKKYFIDGQKYIPSKNEELMKVDHPHKYKVLKLIELLDL